MNTESLIRCVQITKGNKTTVIRGGVAIDTSFHNVVDEPLSIYSLVDMKPLILPLSFSHQDEEITTTYHTDEDELKQGACMVTISDGKSLHIFTYWYKDDMIDGKLIEIFGKEGEFKKVSSRRYKNGKLSGISEFRDITKNKEKVFSIDFSEGEICRN